MSVKPKSPRCTEVDLYKELWHRTSRRVVELDHSASNALEILLRMYLHPDAFALLKRFQVDLDRCSGGTGLTFQDALNELGSSSGVAELQRTLRRLKKEREVA